MVENLEQNKECVTKLSTNLNEDLQELVMKKHSEFLENIHSKKVSERFFFKHSDFSKIETNINLNTNDKQKDLSKSSHQTTKVLFNPDYKNVILNNFKINNK